MLIKIRTTDAAGLFYETVFTIKINDLPEKSITLSNHKLNSYQPIDTTVGYLKILDPFNEQYQYAFFLTKGEGDQDNDKFKILGNILKTKISI